MRLGEYLPLEIGRLTTHVRAALEAGEVDIAWRYIRAKLTMMERVLGDAECPPLDAPESVGDVRWDALLSGALLGILGPQWPAPEPLVELWFPMDEKDAAAFWVKTPPELKAAGVYIRLRDLRWTEGPDRWVDPSGDAEPEAVETIRHEAVPIDLQEHIAKVTTYPAVGVLRGKNSTH